MKTKVFLKKQISSHDVAKLYERDFSASLYHSMDSDSNNFLHSKGYLIILDQFVTKTEILVQAWDLGCGNIISREHKVIECADYIDKTSNVYYAAFTYYDPQIESSETNRACNVFIYEIELNDPFCARLFTDTKQNIFEYFRPHKLTNQGLNSHIEFDSSGFLLWNGAHSSQPNAKIAKYCYNIYTKEITIQNAETTYSRYIDKLMDNYHNTHTKNIHFHRVHSSEELYIVVIEPEQKHINKTYPAIVICLGGPNIDIPDFTTKDSIYNTFSNKGFYVIIPLRRGVKGISYEWEHCIDGHCGYMEVDDIITATKHILNLYQQIDTKEVTLYGGSYGGFISLLIAGKYNHTAIFSRIVSHCGVFDLSTYPDECLGKRKDVMLGYTNCCEETEYKTRIADISPNHFVDNWNVPILLIHAIDDTTVWFGQSVRAYNKAVERNKNVKLMLTPGAHTYHIKGAHSLFNEIIHFALKPV